MGTCNGRSTKKAANMIEKRFAKQNIRLFYRFGKVLGSGSFGTVRLAYNIIQEKNGQQSKPFAVKSINKETVGNQFYLIQRELDILTQLDHPNIIRFFETYEDDRFYHFVMEYCSGGEIFERITKRGTFNEYQAAQIMSKLFSALEYVHQQGIAHRDMKPENLLLCAEDTYDVKIIDFGLSKKYTDKTINENSGGVGTPLYIAPEVLDGGFSLQCDNWSLGCIMYVLMCGTTPFYSQDPVMLAAMIRYSPVKFEEKEWLKVSTEGKQLVMGLLAKDPKKRTTCQLALKGSWIQKFAPNETRNTSQRLPTLNEQKTTLELLSCYASSSMFKKETLKIMLNQLRDTEIQDLKQMFEDMDEDGNGVISADELKQVLGQAGCKATIKDIDLILKNLHQVNQNLATPHIKYSEFLSASLNTKQFLNKQRLWGLYKTFDLNRKGYIEVNDLKHTIEREGRSYSDKFCQEIFQQIDLKNLGKVDFTDFVAIMYTDLKMDEVFDVNELEHRDLEKSEVVGS